MFELAQRGIDGPSIAQLKYSQGDEEIYSDGSGGKILPKSLDEISKESGNPDVLNNLHFSISQDSPVRRVDIQVGPGDWTIYVVESDDQTWALGRYHELTEKLLSDRSWYAKSHAASPQIPQENEDNKWRPAAWELTRGYRFVFGDIWLPALWAPVLLELVGILSLVAAYYDPGDTTEAQDQSDKDSLKPLLHGAYQHSFFLVLVNLSYIVLLIFLRRRVNTLLRSKVIFRDQTFLSSLTFRNNNDTVQLAGLYVAFFALIVSIIALALQ
jgi:hypothetical protein